MSFWDFFKKKKEIPQNIDLSKANSKEEIYKMLFAQMAQKAPSEHFASGAIFDISRQQRERLLQIARSSDALSLFGFYVDAYVLFCNNPSIVRLPPSFVNMKNNDTNPENWNADIFHLENGDTALQCYMPVQNDTIDARIFGIILSSNGDGYYYCMLNKDKNTASDVRKNRGSQGTQKIGEVKGRGFELMNSFLNCITKDFRESGPSLL